MYTNSLSSDLDSEEFHYATEEEADEGYVRLKVAGTLYFREDGIERVVEDYTGQSQRINTRFSERHPEYTKALWAKLYGYTLDPDDDGRMYPQ